MGEHRQAAPEVSVIIPARNAAATIGEQLDALARQSYGGSWEVIVVDDCSTDDTALVAGRYRERLPSLRVVRTAENRNAARARNVGVTAASGRLLLFCDADDVVADDWVEVLVAALSRHEFVCSRMEWTRLNPDWMARHVADRQRSGPQSWEVNGRAYLPHGSAGTTGMTRALYDDVGPFDERFDNCEGPGPEFCFRAHLAGHRLRFVEDAVVHHRLRPTVRGIYRQSRTWAAWTVALEREFVPHSMPRSSPVRGLAAWGAVFARLLLVRDRGDFVGWVRQFAWRVGRVRGSIRFRHLAL